MKRDTRPMSETEMLALCGEALRKVDEWGERGATMVSMEETIALTLYVATTGGALACRSAATEVRQMAEIPNAEVIA